jgi:hypothetical protein
MTPKDFEEACQQPLIITCVVSMVAMLPLNLIGMYTLFTKMDKIFNPHRLMAKQRHQNSIHRAKGKK